MFGEKTQGLGCRKKVIALIVAAGSGRRMNSPTPKQLLMLNGRPILVHTLKRFADCAAVSEIVIVTRSEDIPTIGGLLKEFQIPKVSSVLPGGQTRQESVLNGLKSLPADSLVLIHDGARPFVTPRQIEAVAEAAGTYGAAALGIPLCDTLKRADGSAFILDTVPRDALYRIQTPQAFRTEEITAAHMRAVKTGCTVTDDCAMIERSGRKIKIVNGTPANIKITTAEDLWLAEAICRQFEEDCICE